MAYDKLRFESYARMGGDESFRLIAEKNIERFNVLNPDVERLKGDISRILGDAENSGNPPSEYYDVLYRLGPLEDEMDECCYIACVFTAMYFEAFIYDYAASCLGDQYVKDHIDKMDFMSKWLVVPRLIVGKQIDKEKRAYMALKQIHKDRNALVHLKSRDISLNSLNSDEMADSLLNREKWLHKAIENCKMALKVVVEELYEIDPTHQKLLLLFEGTAIRN